MNFFNYNKGTLYSEGVAIKDIASENATPFYCYSSDAFISNINKLKKAFNEISPKICYSTKSNSNLSILKLLNKGVVVEGLATSKSSVTALEVLAKHDENYMPPEVIEALKKDGKWQEE